MAVSCIVMFDTSYKCVVPATRDRYISLFQTVPFQQEIDDFQLEFQKCFPEKLNLQCFSYNAVLYLIWLKSRWVRVSNLECILPYIHSVHRRMFGGRICCCYTWLTSTHLLVTFLSETLQGQALPMLSKAVAPNTVVSKISITPIKSM